MEKFEVEDKIEKDIQAFSIFAIYDTDFNDRESIVYHLNEVLKLYKNYNRVMFFTDPFFEELSIYYINSYNFLDSYQYEEIVNYCTAQLKIEKYDENDLFSKSLYEYYKIAEEDRDVDDKTFNLIVSTYTYFSNFGMMEEYILKRLLEGTHEISRSTYINFIKRLGNNIYREEIKKYGLEGKVVLSTINDSGYDSDNVGLYVHDENKILLTVKYLKQEHMIYNLETIFHEIVHAKQYSDTDYLDYEKNQIRKELVLRYILLDAYNDNYWSFKYEYDAEYKARLDVLNFIKKYTHLEIDFEPMEYSKNDLRVYDGKQINIDQLFDKVIKDNLSYFRSCYFVFNLEYDENGNRYLVSKFIIEKSLATSPKLIKYYDDLIYKHCYSYREILINIKDLIIMMQKDKEHEKEYRELLYHLINEKFMLQTSNQLKNVSYMNKQLIKKIFGTNPKSK